jgi:hypothetical protein
VGWHPTLKAQVRRADVRRRCAPANKAAAGARSGMLYRRASHSSREKEVLHELDDDEVL